ncbi:PIN domain-containing protein [Mitsuaria sp. GD03876]|uniref:PIN domain-containing protein n=1 Tax=Mitsuaria sp. GD03876 TaxID=2975399 RepID=UPI00244CEEC4|nr:PIN domain-containing protein [Mitsuaria sp. GD03876]MDH0866243.1 PIN domain-containing protein [Mitsuaria sp. GD03876]
MRRAEPLYMLDTNIVSCLMDPPDKASRRYCDERFAALQGRIAISVVVQAEIFYGLEKTRSPRKELRLRELMRRVQVEYLNDDLWFSDLYACIRTQVERIGRGPGKLDMAIAAHAMALDATLISDDKAMSHIEGLRLETWNVPEVVHRRRASGVAEPAAVYLSSDLPRPPAGWMTCSPAARYATAHAR